MAKLTLKYEIVGVPSRHAVGYPISGISPRVVVLDVGEIVSAHAHTVETSTTDVIYDPRTASAGSGVDVETDFLVVVSSGAGVLSWVGAASSATGSIAMVADVPVILSNPHTGAYVAGGTGAIDDTASSSNVLNALYFRNTSGATAATVYLFGVGSEA